jgi:hypothetical protein
VSRCAACDADADRALSTESRRGPATMAQHDPTAGPPPATITDL